MTTATWAPPKVLPRFAVDNDRWDRRWQQEAHDKVDRLAEVTAQLGRVSEAGPDAMADLYFLLSKAQPNVTDEVQPDRAVNQRIARHLADSDQVTEVRRWTVGSQVQTALTCISMGDKLAGLYDEVTDDIADKQTAAQEAYEQAVELAAAAGMLDGGGEPGDDGDNSVGPPPGSADGDGPGADGAPGPTAEQVQAAAAAAAQARVELDEALDEWDAKLGQAVRAAAADAAEQAEQLSTAMSNWGVNPGEQQRLDVDTFLERAELLSTPEMEDITRMLGSMRNMAIGAHREKVDTVPTEVYSVELGRDLGRLLPSEYLGLVVPEMEDDFYRRFASGRLLQYRLRSVEHQAKGNIILLEDGSGSMDGEKFRWAKAFGITVGRIARRDRRGFHVIEFGSPHQQRHHDFPDDKSWTHEAMVDYATSFLDGGTSFQEPIDQAVELLQAEHDATGRSRGDVLIVTDGIARVDTGWVQRFLTVKEQLGFKMYALVIGYDARLDTLAEFCDFAGTITSLTDGTDVRQVFQAL